MPLNIGQILNNRYRIDGLVAKGGFGAVYRAYDFALDRPCALKENLETDPGAHGQFKLEAKVLGNLSHANLPRVIDHFVIPRQGQYLVMDFVEGENLQVMLDRVGGPLSESQVLPWIEQICDALSYLHSQDLPIIHRDIKPLNIILLPDGQAVKLVDFGIIKVGSGPTARAARAATEGYSPPEQYHGTTDARSDVYALGATLYALLTGQQPPASTDRAAGVFLPPPRSINPGISPHIESAISKAMALSQADRYQTIDEFKSAFQSSRKKLVWIAVVLSLIVPGIILCVVFAPKGPQPTARETASLIQTTLTPAVSPITVSSTPQEITVTPAIQATTALYHLHVTQTAVAALEAVTPTPTATPTLGIGSTLVSPIDGLEMVYVPEGEFLMGITEGDLGQLSQICTVCDVDTLRDTLPQRTVYLDAFWLDKTEVTNAQFTQFVTETGYLTSAERTDDFSYVINPSSNSFQSRPDATWQNPHRFGYGISGREEYPVTQISWEDADAYCRWAGRRLPSEAEWEKAARGIDGRFFPWGDELPNSQLLNYNFNLSGPTVVGSYPAGASPYGALDMAGNIREWVADYYSEEYYSVAPEINPIGPATGEGYSKRGASWATTDDLELFLTTAMFRLWNYPYVSSDVTGFRCAMDVEP